MVVFHDTRSGKFDTADLNADLLPVTLELVGRVEHLAGRLEADELSLGPAAHRRRHLRDPLDIARLEDDAGVLGAGENARDVVAPKGGGIANERRCRGQR